MYAVQIGSSIIDIRLAVGAEVADLTLSSDPDSLEVADRAQERLIKPLLGTLWHGAADLPPLRARYLLELPTAVCEILDFGCAPASTRMSEVVEGLAAFYACLRDPGRWNVEAVLLMPDDLTNTKNGERYRGLESVASRSFRLFPASFAPGRYRGLVQCDELIGSIFHESVHLCLEQPLSSRWAPHLHALGWRTTEPGTVVRLPGGSETTRVNILTDELPTSYAAFGQDDDRSESVVCHVFDPARLSPLRRELVADAVRRDARPAPFDLRASSAPVRRTRAWRPETKGSVFVPRGANGATTEIRVVDFDEFVATAGLTDSA